MAIVALNEECNTDNDGLKLAGVSTVELHFSGAHSNGCLKAKGNVDITVHSDEGAITYMDTYKETGNANVDPDPVLTTTKIRTDVIDPRFVDVILS